MKAWQVANSEQIQKAHYDRIARSYEAHYDDPCSQEYRKRFFHAPMFEGLKLAGLNVVEAMCGSGAATQYLLSHGARVTGLDISAEAISSFLARWPACRAVCASVLDSKLESNSFDAIVVVGGLHHLHPQVSAAVGEIHRILKVGGQLCFVEPHQGAALDWIRRYWYRHDPLFASNEASIDLEALKQEFSSGFEFKRESYRGNLAYLLVLNSMVFRLPLRLKPVYTPALLKLEAFISPLQGKRLSCFVVCQWQKR